MIQSNSILKLYTCFSNDGSPNAESFHSRIGAEVFDEIQAKDTVLIHDLGICIWDLSYSNSFSLSSAWQLARQKYVSSLIAKNCWQKQLLQKISFFMWKLLHNAIPTDQEGKKKGICITSKCLCCTISPSIEYNNHLFLSSKTAASIWSFFTNLLNIRVESHTINHMLAEWWQLCKGNNL